MTRDRGRAHAELKELAGLFFRLGATTFGGPAVQIAMMEEEVVRRRGWLNRAEFLDLLAATNLIPGPNSTEMAIHIGYLRAGFPGLFVAGACFIFPAFFLVLAIAWAYVRFGELPEAEALLYGVKPVVIAVVLQALVGLSQTTLKSKLLAAIAGAAAAANLMGLSELAVLFAAGVVSAGVRFFRGAGSLAPLIGTVALSGAQAAAAAPVSLASIGLFFLKVGSILFGSGYVLLAFLRGDLVQRWGWMTESELLDAIAVSQMTPGPVFTAATFIGYFLAGLPGAVVGTLGIFLPGFCLVAASGSLVPRIRRSPTAGAFLDGVVVASLAIMAVVTVELGRSALVDAPAFALAASSAGLLFLFRTSSAWIVPGGAVAGLLFDALGLRA